jgi:16S rRNA (cytosine1402-N4)-methyltransferase
MVNEAISALITDPDGIYVDGTVGSGGHSEAIGKKLSVNGRLICLDRDPEALKMSKERLAFLGNRVIWLHANYDELGGCLKTLGIETVTGLLLDLGTSSFQLDQSKRGFSFNRDEPLDMRMDPADETTAAQLINTLTQQEIKTLLKAYGEEKRASMIATAIERARNKQPFQSSRQLADVIRSVFPSFRRPGEKDPATRSFQAIRIAVNKELDHLKGILDDAPSLIAHEGRLVTLAYHSLEDRIIKQTMAAWEKACICPPDLPECGCGKKALFRPIQKKGIRPRPSEIAHNPRARSAILRAAERTEHG